MSRTGKNIYQRKDGRFEGRYISGRDESGKAKYSYIYGKSKHEVEAKLIEIKSKIKAESMEGKTSFATAVRDWLADRRVHISDASVDRYEYLMEKYILSEFGEKDISAVTMVQLKTYITSLADKDKHGDSAIDSSTMESLESIANSVIAFAKNEELDMLVSRNRVRPEKNSYKPLSDKELKKLVACAKYNRSSDMLGAMLSLFTGIGIGEICALLWDDFNLQSRAISITHTPYRLKNKGGKMTPQEMAVATGRS